MHIRKKKNKSGSTSIVVVDKSGGKYKEIMTIGTSSDEKQIGELCHSGKKWIRDNHGEPDMFAEYERKQEEKLVVEHLLSNVENILLNGTKLILDKVFDLIGFNAIDDDIFRSLVLARICHPRSKLATIEYLKSHFDEDVGHNEIYRYLDKLQDSQKGNAEKISVEHTRKILGGKIGMAFYDVTTLYFETDEADDLRKPGFSKDGRHSQPQIVLGLLVSTGGYPLAYSIHEGNKYEGHTMLPVVEKFVREFNLGKFVIIADSGLMNKDNISELESKNYKYILGARIKSESEAVRQWIFSLEKKNGAFYEYKKSGSMKLIVGYSDDRARKDRYNREKGVRRLEKEFRTGTLTKTRITKRGYNKFLEVSDDVKVIINQGKIKEDELWDGFKGYVTNSELSGQAVYEEYSELWQVERAFRIAKGTLEMRPMFHFTEKRIKAHVCICFVAYKVYKELDRILKIGNANC
ncbi:MAG: IS1634 family transposase [Fibromonadales bacterium]|nr:IS1634 family transposase [Fibromonadales bacterium]